MPSWTWLMRPGTMSYRVEANADAFAGALHRHAEKVVAENECLFIVDCQA
jgi:hypothetical protein